MSIYEVLKRVVTRGDYDAEDIQNKTDVFVRYDHLSMKQYGELLASMVA